MDKAYKPQLTVQLRPRKILPASITPTFMEMRPDPSYDPTVKLVEQLSDMGFLVIITPASDDRIDLLNKLLCCYRSFSTSPLSDLFLEVVNGFLTRVSIKRSLNGTTFDPMRR